ncbi:LecA/PA-IL family lectin [Olivibacter domesticus]|uniref:von Willebrand factor type A domain-containing protein n=1 Tax=Olivibacter domesticus TaxID=407022 RepID=A0A1H7UD95_OLID1|nr:LecA/PA-IL family lectin [Olivibacter domesticus]SEL94675.1 von Willebrand factor type A domain-containing protein [Olivibacter domesticus]
MSENTKKVDLVIVIDTSGSMKSTAEAISKAIASAVDEAKSSCPSDLRVDYLGIEGTFENTKFDETIRNYLTKKGVNAASLKSRVRKSLPGAGANEDGARAVEDVSEHYDWREGAERAIFLLQDESLDAGEMVVTPAAVKANDNAIATALKHNVKVNTYLGAPHTPYPTKKDEEDMIEEFTRLASKTGGEHFIHTSGMANFKDVLKKTICASKVPQEESIEEKENPCGCKDKDPCVSQRWEGYLPAVQAEGVRTGIQVKKGDKIDILASGFAKYGADYPWHGPQGHKENSQVGRLFVQIGDTQTPIGTGVFDWIAPSDGEIVFLYGDIGHENNEGGFDIKLKVGTNNNQTTDMSGNNSTHDCGKFQIQVGVIDLVSDKPSATKVGDDSTFITVTFPKPYPVGSQVVVVPEVQTFNGPDTPGLRISQVTNTGFKIRMNELVAYAKPLSGGEHNVEKIAWVAFLIQ